MPNKSIAFFLFAFLTTIPAYAASLEYPNSVSTDQNTIQTIIEKANKGDADAQSKLGRLYLGVNSGDTLLNS
jgi:hypothetical protein